MFEKYICGKVRKEQSKLIVECAYSIGSIREIIRGDYSKVDKVLHASRECLDQRHRMGAGRRR